MKTYLFVYVGAMILSGVLTSLVARFARRLKLMDKPSARKVHSQPTPRLGGIAILISTLCMVAPVLILQNLVGESFRSAEARVVAVLCAAIVVFVVGILDDVIGLPSIFKLVAITGAAVIVCASGSLITRIQIGAGIDWHLGLFAWPVTMCWIIGVTVSLNFIDGLDGLAAGIAAIACGVIAAVAASYGQMVTAVLALALLGSLSGFLFHNVHPAKIFMGDCGSMTVGFLLAASSVICATESHSFLGVLVPAMALTIPLFDTFFTVIRRGVLQRRPLFAAERGHIHHRLMKAGLSQPHVVLVLCGLTFCSASAGVIIFLSNKTGILSTAVLLLMPLFLFRFVGLARIRKVIYAVKRNYVHSRSTKGNNDVFAEMELKLGGARSMNDWWTGVCAAAEAMQITRVALPLQNRDGSTHVLMWSRPDCDLPMDQTITATIPVRQRRTGPALRCEVAVSGRDSLELAGHRAMMFSRLLEEHSVANLPQQLRSARSLPNLDIQPNGKAIAISTPEGALEAEPPYLKKKLWGPRLHQPTVAGESTDIAPIAAKINGETPRRIAVVHDFLYCYAGAERVLEQILEIYPEADVFSLFDFVPHEQRGFLKGKKVTVSFLQRMPLARRKHRAYLPLMPLAIEQLDVSSYDIVISSSYLAAKGIVTRADQMHICYCHTPVRFAWDLQRQYLAESGLISGVKSILARAILHYIRSWDVQSANRVDRFVTNSHFVAARIGKIYRRESTVIYPPVDVEGFRMQPEKDDFYLTLSRLVPYKKIDLVVEAFTKLKNRRLIVIGDGPEMEKIKAKAGPNVTLLGYQPSEHVREYMQRAKAFVFAAEEDFGIVSVEAQACGTPVIAFARGGATETVVDGRTGVFFHRQTVESLLAAVKEFESNAAGWNPATIRANAERFSADRFRDEFREIVENDWMTFNRTLEDRRLLGRAPELPSGLAGLPETPPLLIGEAAGG